MEKDMTMYSIILKFFRVEKHSITKRTVLFATMVAMTCTIFPACNNNERIISTDKFNGYPVSLVYNNEDKVYKLKFDYSDDDRMLWKIQEQDVDTSLIINGGDMPLNILFENKSNYGTITAKSGAQFDGIIYNATLPLAGIWNYPDGSYEIVTEYLANGNNYFVYIKIFSEDFESDYNTITLLIPANEYTCIDMNTGIIYFEKSKIAAFGKGTGEFGSTTIAKYDAKPDWKIDSTTYKPIINTLNNGFEAFYTNNERFSIDEINQIFNWMVAYYNMADLSTPSGHSYNSHKNYYNNNTILVDSDCFNILMDISWNIRWQLFAIANDIRKPLSNDIFDMYEDQAWFKDKLAYLRAVEKYLRYDIQSSAGNSSGTVESSEWIRCKLQKLISESRYNSYYYDDIRRLVSYDMFIRYLSDICLNDLLVQISRERDRIGDSAYVIE